MLRIDGDVVVDNTDPVRGTGFYGAGSEPMEADCELAAGATYELAVEVWPRSASSPILGARIGASAGPTPATSSSGPSAAAAAADVAVVVVGSNGEWESEGHDRPDLALPGRQRELVEAVIEANPTDRRGRERRLARSSMPWAERAAAVLLTWYAGEEGADALADVLTGVLRADGAAPHHLPGPGGGRADGLGPRVRYPGVDGPVAYGEGVYVGYRHFETAGTGSPVPLRARALLRRRRLRRGRRDDGPGAGPAASTRARGAAPRWSRSTCARSSLECRGRTGSWWGS